MTGVPIPKCQTQFAFRLTLGIVAAVTLVRCLVLVLSPLDLYPDEAQYWWWAQAPDLGYYSKPPMIAWIVRVSTALFGNAEWALRLPAPLFHGATALLVFGIARQAVNARLSLLSALAYLTLPGVSWSSGLISTDVPLLFFWAMATYAFLRACEDMRWRWPLLCGVALGLGLESKYAMFYFPLGAVIAGLLVCRARAVVFGTRGLAILGVGLLLLAPNIVWNALHGFPTVAHTEANADWGRSRYSIGSAAGFLFGQFGVFGPVLMAGLIGAIWRLAREKNRPEPDLILAAFGLPSLVLILVQSFIAGANANWAATAFVAATPLAVAELARWWRGRAIWVSFAINTGAMLVLWIFLVRPQVADAIGAGNALKREEGWHELGTAVAHESEAKPYTAIVADNRSVVAELLYYAQPRKAPIRIWARDLSIRDHFEMTLRLSPGTARVLLVLEPPSVKRVLATFDSARPIKSVPIPVGGSHIRAIDLYDAVGYRGAQNSADDRPGSRAAVL
ncbi:MAG TPA: glycosyltransferase family 39 protein [Rhizomicrobium sp.]|nr:glycosyltransferase family 39 protein [Rhizomicrobium sp.]